jgi:hypothetical protein
MNNFTLTLEAMTHVVFARMRKVIPDAAFEQDVARRDRGAVSLEQALWYAAAAALAGGVAFTIWTQVRTQADRPVDVPF